MTTADSYYFLRWAKEYIEGTYSPQAEDPPRHYQRLQYPVDASEFWPGSEGLDWMPQRQPRRLPMLSWLIASVTPLTGSVDLAGLYLTPILASLFMIPMFLYAWRIGEPVAGLIGGLIGALAPVYFARTQVGYVDTDCLNLFFPWLASLLILLIDKDTRRLHVLLASAAVGFTLYAYFRWYDKPAVAALFWGTLALRLVLQRKGAGLTASAVAICVVCSHPVQAAQSLGNASGLIARYLGGSNPGDGLSAASAFFPNVMETIVEQRGAHGLAAFGDVLQDPGLAIVGLAVIAAFALRRWRQFAPLLPILIMAVFTFISGPRFAMYLAPFAGLGLGVLISELARVGTAGLAQPPLNAAPTSPVLRHGQSAAAIAGLILLSFWLWLSSPATHGARKGGASVPAETMRAVQRMRAEMPRGVPMWTWWDHGFALVHLGGFSVYHDGGAQYTPQTNVIAHTFMSDDQESLHRIMSTVDRFGNKGIAEMASKQGSRDAMLLALAQPPAENKASREIYLAFTRSMIEVASVMRYMAGMPIRTTAGEPILIESLDCSELLDDALKCKGFSVDLRTGEFTDGRTVRRLVVADNGEVVENMDYTHETGFVLELLIGPNRSVEALRVPDAIYESNLNRMFLLGEYDRALFEETFREMPAIRVFRRKARPSSPGP